MPTDNILSAEQIANARLWFPNETSEWLELLDSHESLRAECDRLRDGLSYLHRAVVRLRAGDSPNGSVMSDAVEKAAALLAKPTEERGMAEIDESECDCCRSRGVRVKEFTRSDGSHFAGQKTMLCAICSATYLGVMVDWPSQYSAETVEICKTIAFVGNLLLKELRQSEPGAKERRGDD
jgi:hypothetical protein